LGSRECHLIGFDGEHHEESAAGRSAAERSSEYYGLYARAARADSRLQGVSLSSEYEHIELYLFHGRQNLSHRNYDN
jgi:hypothetical protein